MTCNFVRCVIKKFTSQEKYDLVKKWLDKCKILECSSCDKKECDENELNKEMLNKE